MSKKIRFKEEYIGLVRDIGMAWDKVTNRMMATRLKVDEKTIRSWRKEHHEFDLAFINSRALSQEKLNQKARNNLEVRKKKIVKQSEDGEVVITEDVLPTHNDIAAYEKLSIRASGQIEERTLLRDIMKRKIAGELSAIEASQLLESEGITVPKTLMLEVQKEIGGTENISDILTNLGELMTAGRQRRKDAEKRDAIDSDIDD